MEGIILLFILLLWELAQRYPQAKVIHGILDNDCIHKTQQVEVTLATNRASDCGCIFCRHTAPTTTALNARGAICTPKSPRNHTCGDMKSLMRNVQHHFKQHNQTLQQTQTAA